MDDKMDLSPAERYELTKLRILTEVQSDLSTWAKRRAWLLLAVVALVSFFGVGGFISATVGQGIEKRMESVNAQIVAAVRSAIEAETSARQATRAAESENRRISETAATLKDTLDKIAREASRTEEQLVTLRKTLESRSENVRGESRLLNDALERRLANLERLISQTAKSTGGSLKEDVTTSAAALEAKAKRERETFIENSKYEIQVVYTDRHSALAKTLVDIYRRLGYRTSPFDFPDWAASLQKFWGASEDFVGNQVTILSPPGNDALGKRVADVLRADARVANPKSGTDNRSTPGRLAVGVLIPPGYER